MSVGSATGQSNPIYGAPATEQKPTPESVDQPTDSSMQIPTTPSNVLENMHLEDGMKSYANLQSETIMAEVVLPLFTSTSSKESFFTKICAFFGVGSKKSIEQKRPEIATQRQSTVSHTRGGPFHRVQRFFTSGKRASMPKLARGDTTAAQGTLTRLSRHDKANINKFMNGYSNARSAALTCLALRGVEKTPELNRSEAQAICGKFLAEDSGMAAFIHDQESEIQQKILTALASPNCGVAMSVLLHAKEMGMPLKGDFFDDLCRQSSGHSHVFLKAEELIQSQDVTKVNSEWGDEHRVKRGIAAFLESDEVGSKFFMDEEFDGKLDLVSKRLGADLQFAKDLLRDFGRWEIIINGEVINFDHCQHSPQEAAIKFLLQKLQASGLPPDAAFNALKSLCRYAWMQGESTRPMAALSSTLEDETEKQIFDIAIMRAHTATPSKMKVELQSNGNVKVSSLCVVTSQNVTPQSSDARECIFGQLPKYDPEKTYLTAFTSIECNPNGEHRILDSMMACRIGMRTEG
ncbi:MAG: hypothetical protein LBI34_00485 [Puniceicoccales bacterium]|jgi:hypothetical protein|nr:hypothetical protein [Puniceicoccales bacterium]